MQVDAMETTDIRALAGVLPFFSHLTAWWSSWASPDARRDHRHAARFELESFLRVLQEWPIALVHVVPPVAVALAKHPVVDSYNLSGVRWIFLGGRPLGAELAGGGSKRACRSGFARDTG